MDWYAKNNFKKPKKTEKTSQPTLSKRHTKIHNNQGWILFLSASAHYNSNTKQKHSWNLQKTNMLGTYYSVNHEQACTDQIILWYTNRNKDISFRYIVIRRRGKTKRTDLDLVAIVASRISISALYFLFFFLFILHTCLLVCR